MKKLIFTLTLVLGLASLAFGQTILTTTTLSSAVTTPTQGSSTPASPYISVTSATGITAASTLLYVDNEVMFVEAANSTFLTVTRGYFGSVAHAHSSGALVWLGPPYAFFDNALLNDPAGSCKRSNETYLPHINTRYGVISDCLGGQWVNGVNAAPGNTTFHVMAPEPGGVAYTTLGSGGAGTTTTTTVLYCTEVDLHENKLLTGIADLNGAGVANGNRVVGLYDSTGNLLAKSAATVTATASVYQSIAFSSTYYALGPAVYFACMNDSSASDSVRMLITGQQDNSLTIGVTGLTTQVLPATFTAPTVFHTAVGPYSFVY